MNQFIPTLSADEQQVNGRHYLDMPMQPWDVMQAVLTPEEFRGFLKGNVIKYAMRQGKKDGTDDAGKAQHYAQKLAEIDAQEPRDELEDMTRAGLSHEGSGTCGNVGMGGA